MFFNFGLMGSLLAQVCKLYVAIFGNFRFSLPFIRFKDHYYTSFPRDKHGVKVIVYTLLILELAQTMIMSYCA